MPHLPREQINPRLPVHVTLRVRPGIGYLRAQRRARAVVQALNESGLRLVHYSIQGNHLHLIIEAEDSEMLARGMQGLAIRIAKRLNALQNRRGPVFVDRYHAHLLRSRREVANAVRYLYRNYRKHSSDYLEPRWSDPLTSSLAAPRTWLLKTAPPPGRGSAG